MTGDHSENQEALNKIDVTVPHSARIWNYWLGGEDNFEIDRVVERIAPESRVVYVDKDPLVRPRRRSSQAVADPP
jgi:hypothetical protein